MRMHHLVTAGSPTVQYFSNYLINSTVFEKRVIDHKCVLILSTLLSEIFIIIRRSNRNIIKMSIDLHVKYPLFFSDFN